MPQKVLSESFLKSVKPPASRTYYSEPGRKGFELIHNPGGELTFRVRYKIAGESRTMTLGTWPSLSLATAHEAHGEARKLIGRGVDPKQAKADEIARASAERERVAVESGTFGELFDSWFATIERRRKRPGEVRAMFERDVLPLWRKKVARSITKHDARALFAVLVDERNAPVAANRLFSVLLQLFTWASGEDLVGANPLSGMARPGGEEFAKERFLPAPEIREFWIALDKPETKIQRRIRLALRLILVTGQRPGEVLGMKWGEIDTENQRWTIPGDVVRRRRIEGRVRSAKEFGRTKNGREQVIPLTALAVAILDELRADAIASCGSLPVYVVPAWKEDKRMTAHIEEKAMARALRNNVVNPESDAATLFGFEPFTPHDLRRTVATHLSELGVARFLVKRVLNHVPPSDDVTEVYDKHHYLTEIREALEKWEALLLRIIGAPVNAAAKAANSERLTRGELKRLTQREVKRLARRGERRLLAG